MVHFLIVHVTLLLIVAFFILFAASKADGIVRLFGNILGVWVILVAILHIVAHFVPGALGMKPGMHEGMMHDGMMHEHWMHHWGDSGQVTAPATAAPAAPAPAKPAAPAPATPPKKS